MPQLNGYEGRVVTIDARTNFRGGTWKIFPELPMLAAVVATTGVMPKETFLHEMRASYKHKFAKKPEVIRWKYESTGDGFCSRRGSIEETENENRY